MMTIDHKITLVILFVFLIQISPSIQSVACYTCIDCGDPFNAQSVNVSKSLSVCAYCYKLTVFVAYAPSRYVIKECVQTCSEQGTIFGGASLQVNCCSSSFCNNALQTYRGRNLYLLISTFVLIFFIGYIK